MIGEVLSYRQYFDMIESQVAALPRDFPFAHIASASVLDMLQKLHTYQVEQYFPQLTRYSAIVTTVTLFEDQAHGICEVLRKLKSIPVAWTELRGDLLNRFRTYTTKLAGLEPPDAREWERLKAVHVIRGAIVHANGYARGAWKDRLKKLVGKVDGFSLGEDGRVRLGSERMEICECCDDQHPQTRLRGRSAHVSDLLENLGTLAGHGFGFTTGATNRATECGRGGASSREF